MTRHRRLLRPLLVASCLASLGLALGLTTERPVEARGQPSSSPNLRGCGRISLIDQCLLAELEPLLRGQRFRNALELLKAQVSDDPSLQGWCHAVTHEIGHRAWQARRSIKAAFQLGDPTCWSGFYHGVMESAVAAFPRPSLADRLTTTCGPIDNPKRPSLDFYNCVHGLGHGILPVRGDDWRTAVVDCQRLTTPWERKTCAGGVLMQKIINAQQPIGHRTDFREDDWHYPCSVIDEELKETCYLIQTSHWFFRTSGNVGRVAEEYRRVEPPLRQACFRSLGRDIHGQFRTDELRVLALCRSAEAGFADCVIGAARNAIFNDHHLRAARRLCQRVAEPQRSRCLKIVRQDARRL